MKKFFCIACMLLTMAGIASAKKAKFADDPRNAALYGEWKCGKMISLAISCNKKGERTVRLTQTDTSNLGYVERYFTSGKKSEIVWDDEGKQALIYFDIDEWKGSVDEGYEGQQPNVAGRWYCLLCQVQKDASLRVMAPFLSNRSKGDRVLCLFSCASLDEAKKYITAEHAFPLKTIDENNPENWDNMARLRQIIPAFCVPFPAERVKE